MRTIWSQAEFSQSLRLMPGNIMAAHGIPDNEQSGPPVSVGKSGQADQRWSGW